MHVEPTVYILRIEYPWHVIRPNEGTCCFQVLSIWPAFTIPSRILHFSVIRSGLYASRIARRSHTRVRGHWTSVENTPYIIE